MKLANIFGLHLGCKVRTVTEDFILSSVGEDGECYTKHGDMYSLKDCRLVLKPFPDILEEHAEVLEKHFLGHNREGDSLEGWSWDLNSEGFHVWFKKYGGPVLFCGYTTMALLSSLGYDSGIVPDEHKIVE